MLGYHDRVRFTIIRNEGTDTFDYTVFRTYLECDGKHNDIIFDKLSIDKTKFCEKHYGYESENGNWPECEKDDFEALTRVVTALHELCNIKNKTTIDLHGLYK